MTAYYLRVFALIPCLGLLLGPAAIILGCFGIAHKKKQPTSGGMAHAVVGIVLGSLVTLAHVAAVIFFLVVSSGR